MNAYASHSGTRRNLAAMRDAGWRIMVNPAKLHTGGMPFALDNGAWSAHQQGRPWDPDAFLRAVKIVGAAADFVVVPDIVGDGRRSHERTMTWLPFLLGHTRQLLIAVQDGMHDDLVIPYLGANVGIFVGGTTAWKLAT